MSTTETKTTDPEAEVTADLEAVMNHAADGTQVEPELARRVQERSRRLTEELRRNNVHIDIEQLIRDSRDEA